ncbi:Oidioi.mRNA.OKI2018_I69.chr1.g1644.t1.cds [Oikopleura dioica]|uniref:Oidioi.mRNA.OKI2018_I69.chr1.g1644.t1.cds n=1 Tax=Oikopleura dioica TaxID=34765 RepID=A0ABN7SUV0_OIKDI|nr:Oidioi.mRNA.OKI2018_I69.chr1.g1644.t1.cds [Oikopleura dioica]
MLKVESKEIGAGHFSNVFYGQLKCYQNSMTSSRISGISVAVKRFNKEKCCAKLRHKILCPNIREYFKEASFVLRAKSKFVVEIYGIAIEDDNHPVIVMPLYNKNKSISEYVSNSSNIIRFTSALKLLFQCASGFDYLAQNRIVHRDISAKNILLDDNLIPKISDFGLSSCAMDDYGSCYYTMRTTDKPQPLRNFAPEVFNLEFSTYSDIYSFGYVIWEVLNRGGHPLDAYLLRQTWSYERSERKSFTRYFDGFKAAYNYIGQKKGNIQYNLLNINLQIPSILRVKLNLSSNHYLHISAAEVNNDYRNWLIQTESARFLRPEDVTFPRRNLVSASSSVSNRGYRNQMNENSNNSDRDQHSEAK